MRRRLMGVARTVRGQRGSMLLLALMVLLGLTSVGLVASHNTNSELAYAGNVRKGVSAFRVAEGGAFTALGHAANMGVGGFMATLGSTTIDPAAGTSRWLTDDMVTVPYFDTTKSGSFGYEGFAESSAAGASTPFDIWVDIEPTGMRQPLVGYSFSGPGARCRFKYQFDAQGSVGNPPTGATTEQAQRAWQVIRTRMFVGPLPCNQAAQSGFAS